MRRGDQLQEIIPNIHPITVNLPSTAPEMLKSQGGYFGCVLQLLQARKSDEEQFNTVLGQVIGELEKMPRRQSQRWLELLSYVHAIIQHERQPQEQAHHSQTILDSVKKDPRRQKVFDMSKTIADVLREEEAVNSRREILQSLVRERYGKLPAKMRKAIQTTKDRDLLDAWLMELVTANSLQEFAVKWRTHLCRLSGRVA